MGDLDGIYDPSNDNDRLLLGLNGDPGGSGVHVLKQRLLAGKRAKAEHGELGIFRLNRPANLPCQDYMDFIAQDA